MTKNAELLEALMQMNDVGLQIFEAAKWPKRACIDAGFDEEAAQTMAMLYYAALIDATFHK